MTERELKKLRRVDLIEMLLEVTRENEQLYAEIAQMQKKLDEKRIIIENSGSLAEAAMRLNGVFEAAQAACDQYLESIKAGNE